MKKRIFSVACVGNILEFYDFSIYTFLIPIISPLFFPAEEKITSIVIGFSFFFVGFLARPLGSLIFGYLGDKRGRRFSLSISLLGMALSTALIAILPTYNQIGILAPFMLVLLRIIHGICIGGEFIGSLIFLVEHMPSNQKKERGAFYTSCLVASTIMGWFLGSLLCLFSSELNFLGVDYWRIPFFFGLITAVVGYIIRKYSPETPEFLNIKVKEPSLNIMKSYSREFLAIFGIGGLIGALFYGLFIFPNSYLPEFVGVDYSLAQIATTIGIALYMIFLPIMGRIADKIVPGRLVVYSAFLSLCFAYPIFFLFSTGKFFCILGAEFLSALLIAGFMAPASFVITQIFPINIRYTTTALSYNLGVSILGGMSPLVCIWLLKQTGNLISSFMYLFLCGALALICSIVLCRRSIYQLKDA